MGAALARLAGGNAGTTGTVQDEDEDKDKEKASKRMRKKKKKDGMESLPVQEHPLDSQDPSQPEHHDDDAYEPGPRQKRSRPPIQHPSRKPKKPRKNIDPTE